MKADLAIYSHVVDAAGQCMSESLTLVHNLNFSTCDILVGFCKSSHKLTLCKPLFIVNVRVKGPFKVILEYKNEALQLKKWVWHVHNEIV